MTQRIQTSIDWVETKNEKDGGSVGSSYPSIYPPTRYYHCGPHCGTPFHTPNQDGKCDEWPTRCPWRRKHEAHLPQYAFRVLLYPSQTTPFAVIHARQLQLAHTYSHLHSIYLHERIRFADVCSSCRQSQA